MFPIVVNDGQTPFPDEDIFYIICKEGIYLKKRLGVMESIAPVKNISILESVNAMAKMHIKKIPATKFQQIINFFKEVYKEYFAEAIVLIFYNQETKKYRIICPKQEVSGAGADYTKGMIIEGYDMIGTVHSHAAMSAFHSGIDDDDEKSFDGLHITLGNMKDDYISISASIVANGYRVIVSPNEYINKLVMTVDIDEEVKVPYAKTWKWDHDKKKMVQLETTGKYYTRRNFDQRFEIQLSKDPKFNPAWMNLVEKKTFTPFNYKTYNRGWADGWYGHNAHYGDSSYWKNWSGHHNTKGPVQTKLPMVVKSDDKESVDEDNKLIQVLENLYDHEKKTVAKWVLDQIDGDSSDLIKESLGEDNNDLVHYECIQCQNKITVDESDTSTGEAFCPICKTDDYLLEITATEMMMGESAPSDEEIEESGLGMIECKTCHSSFTKDFLINGECPTCGTVLVPEEHPSNQEISEEILKTDSGAYLDPEREAIEKALEADQDVERIPLPDQDTIPINKKPRKPGVFANLFNKRRKYKR